jgi:predicted acylesterase/phospholipase RssA
MATTNVGIVLSGTAPAMTLMSGAMLAFAERGVEFDVISTTGVGGLIGLLYLAPKGGDRITALRELPNLFVSDWLYRLFPVNFKVFHKYSPFANAFREFRKTLPKFRVEPAESSEVKRFVNDWLELWATAITPASLEFRRNGLMSHTPLVEELVDFERLKHVSTRFYLNAFSLRTLRLRQFTNQTMNATAYNAAQAMFVLFPPVNTADDILTSGATRDPTGLQAIWSYERSLSRVVALDPVSRSYWRMPVNAYDAFQLMLMNPIAALQELMFTVYVDARTAGAPLPALNRLPVAIDSSYYPKMLEWTHTNAMTLQKIGYDAAEATAKALAANRPEDIRTLDSDTYSFARFLEDQPRPRQFRQMFTRAFDRNNRSQIVEYLRGRYQTAPAEQGKVSS